MAERGEDERGERGRFIMRAVHRRPVLLHGE